MGKNPSWTGFETHTLTKVPNRNSEIHIIFGILFMGSLFLPGHHVSPRLGTGSHEDDHVPEVSGGWQGEPRPVGWQHCLGWRALGQVGAEGSIQGGTRGVGLMDDVGGTFGETHRVEGEECMV